MRIFQKSKVEHEQASQQELMHLTIKKSLLKSEVFQAHKKDLREAEEPKSVVCRCKDENTSRKSARSG